MVNLFIDLVIIAILVDIYCLRLVHKGVPAFAVTSNEQIGWVGQNLVYCLLFGSIYTIVHHYLLGGIPPVDLGPSLRGDFGAFFVLGGLLWVVNMAFFSVSVNCSLEGYIKYKKGCLRTGVDLKEHLNKYFVLTSKTNWAVQEYDGLRADVKVKLYKANYSKNWLGEYPVLTHVSDLVVLPEVKLQKDIISGYVQEYFSARGQYLIEGDKLEAIGDKPLDVIVIK